MIRSPYASPAMTDVLAFDVPGIPAPQGSLRAFARRGGGPPIVTADNARTRPWKQAVTAAAAALRREVVTGPVNVRLDFRFPRPAAHYGSGRNVGVVRPAAPAWPAGRPDLDKLSRACLDALTDAGIWRDDAQVVSLAAAKRYCLAGEGPGVHVVVVAPGDHGD